MKNYYVVSVFFDVPILAETEAEAEQTSKKITADVPEKALFSAYKPRNQSDENKRLAVNYGE